MLIQLLIDTNIQYLEYTNIHVPRCVFNEPVVCSQHGMQSYSVVICYPL